MNACIKTAFPVLLSMLLFVQNGITGQVKTDKIPNGHVYRIVQADPSYQFDSSVYTVFIPEDIKTIRGIFIHQHGCGMEGRGISTAYDVQYQAFAKKWGLAIIGPDLYSASGGCHNWRFLESGSDRSLIKTLDEVADLSGHPEIARAPWLLWGHSGGGYWTIAMLNKYPERIMALFAYSPAFDMQWDFPEEALKVPVMIRHAGENDLNDSHANCHQTAIDVFNRLRKRGGYVSLAPTPYQDHTYSYVRYMAIPFYESILAQRLSDTDPALMNDMNSGLAWLGDTLALNTYKDAKYMGDKYSLGWLPDSLVAAKWKEYVITGTVIDKTPPPAPYDIRMNVVHSRKITLNWKADADIESGIGHFNIYKGDALIARFPSMGDFQWFDTNGDDTIPVSDLPEMKLEITGIAMDHEKISISTVNRFGLESVRTEVY